MRADLLKRTVCGTRLAWMLKQVQHDVREIDP
jgi:hypothetical protein